MVLLNYSTTTVAAADYWLYSLGVIGGLLYLLVLFGSIVGILLNTPVNKKKRFGIGKEIQFFWGASSRESYPFLPDYVLKEEERGSYNAYRLLRILTLNGIKVRTIKLSLIKQEKYLKHKMLGRTLLIPHRNGLGQQRALVVDIEGTMALVKYELHGQVQYKQVYLGNG